MKKRILSLLPLCIFLFASGQNLPGRTEISHYVFPEFIQGSVLKKSGERVNTHLNYNTLTEEMIFMNSGTPLALDETQYIDTVYVQNRRFIPFGKVFYEVATNTPIALFIQHKSKLIAPGKNTGFGSSQTSAITNISNVLGQGGAYQLSLPDDYKVIPQITYWLKTEDRFIKLDNLKGVQAMFPGKANLIREYVRENKLAFDKPEDVAKIIVFAN